MSVPHDPPLPKIGSPVTTACNGIIYYEVDTPTALFRGQRIYFCLPSCLKSFQDDPKTSCLVDNINQHNE